MKKILCILGGAILLLGGGCVSTMFNNPPTSTTTTVEQKSGSHWVDYKYLDKAFNEGGSIKELKIFDRSFAMPDTSIFKAQINKYFQLNNATFALFQAGGVQEERAALLPTNMERAGVLYALNDDKQWHIFFEVANKEETDHNNPVYLWNENKKINILVHDVVGANNGEGTAKMVVSNDLGKTWKIERCFYLNMNEFNKLQQKNKTNFLTTLTAYLKAKFQNGYLNEEYILNQKTGNFEYPLSNNDEPNKNKIVDSCKNILLP